VSQADVSKLERPRMDVQYVKTLKPGGRCAEEGYDMLVEHLGSLVVTVVR